MAENEPPDPFDVASSFRTLPTVPIVGATFYADTDSPWPKTSRDDERREELFEKLHAAGAAVWRVDTKPEPKWAGPLWVFELLAHQALPDCLLAKLIEGFSRRDAEELREATLAEIKLDPRRTHELLVSALYRLRVVTLQDARLMLDPNVDVPHKDGRLDLDQVVDRERAFDVVIRSAVGMSIGVAEGRAYFRTPRPNALDASKEFSGSGYTYIDEAKFIDEAGAVGKIGEFSVTKGTIQQGAERIRLKMRPAAEREPIFEDDLYDLTTDRE